MITFFKKIILFVFICFSYSAFSQIVESFSDTSLLQNGTWNGQIQSFKIDNESLKSNHQVPNSTFYVSYLLPIKNVNEWHIDVMLLFNTSSLNFVDFVFKSDTTDLLNSKNNFLVRIGGVSDDIALIKTTNGLETKLIDGDNGLLNSSNSSFKIIIKQYNDSFQLSYIDLKTNQLKIEGFSIDSNWRIKNIIGFKVKQSTASFFNKHSFDNLYAGPLLIDTLAPVIDSLKWLNQQQVSIFFSEVCDTNFLKKFENYEVPNFDRPSNISVQDNGNQVLLSFDSILPFNKLFNIYVKDIYDLEGNKMDSTSISFKIYKTDKPEAFDIVINELMIDPEPSAGLPNKEYVELLNRSKKFIQLNKLFINDPTQSIKLPFFVLEPDSMIVLYNIPSLNNTSDRIWISDSSAKIINEVNYTDNWYRNEIKKSGGYSLELIDPNKTCLKSENWIASSALLGGTPNQVNSVRTDLPNDTIAPFVTQIRSFNNDSLIEITLSEEIDSLFLLNFIITIDKEIVSKELISYLNSKNTMLIKLFFVPNKKIRYNFEFIGLQDCIGNTKISSISWQWPSKANKSEIIVNEVLFNPKSGGKDFIELYNKSEYSFNLSDLFFVEIDELGQYLKILPLNESSLYVEPKMFVLLSEDTSNICKIYQCGNGDNVIKIQVDKLPTMPDTEGRFLLVNQQDLIIDSLYYSEKWHLNLISDKEGISLERIEYNAPTGDKNNWFSASAFSGYATPGKINSQVNKSQISNTNYFYTSQKTISPDSDGFEDYLSIYFQLPNQDFIATIQIFDQEGRFIKTILNNELLGNEGFVNWDGTDFNNQKTEIGKYIIMVTAYSIEGKTVVKEKIPVIVAAKF